MHAFPEAAKRGSSGGRGALNLFLSVYVLVFAFFLLLYSISNFEAEKSRAVMDSVTSAFSGLLPPATDPTRFASREGEALGGQRFQDRVKGVFAAAIPAARVEIIQPGRDMRVQLRAHDLFEAASAAVREAHGPLLRRLAEALADRPAGLRFDVEFVLDVPAAREAALPVAETLEMARAGAFAREMTALGAPADSVAVGLKPGPAEEATLWFHVRPEGEIRLPFQGDAGRGRR
jgi:flagellar motor protein MotB